MNTIEIQEHARKLKDTHGDKAIMEAVEKARELEEAGDKEQAENWRRTEAALMQLRGPPRELNACAVAGWNFVSRRGPALN